MTAMEIMKCAGIGIEYYKFHYFNSKYHENSDLKSNGQTPPFFMKLLPLDRIQGKTNVLRCKGLVLLKCSGSYPRMQRMGEVLGMMGDWRWVDCVPKNAQIDTPHSGPAIPIPTPSTVALRLQ